MIKEVIMGAEFYQKEDWYFSTEDDGEIAVIHLADLPIMEGKKFGRVLQGFGKTKKDAIENYFELYNLIFDPSISH